MKKIIAIFLVVALFATSVFAVPAEENFDFDVDAVELTDSQAENVEGEGFLGGLISGILGGIASGIAAAISIAIKGDYSSPRGSADNILNAMCCGFATSFAIGACIPIP